MFDMLRWCDMGMDMDTLDGTKIQPGDYFQPENGLLCCLMAETVPVPVPPADPLPVTAIG
jgi:hypothetical protein